MLPAALLEKLVDEGSIHSLERELLPEGPLAARSRPIPRLDPQPRELLVVEHAEINELGDRSFHQLGPIAR